MTVIFLECTMLLHHNFSFISFALIAFSAASYLPKLFSEDLKPYQWVSGLWIDWKCQIWQSFKPSSIHCFKHWHYQQTCFANLDSEKRDLCCIYKSAFFSVDGETFSSFFFIYEVLEKSRHHLAMNMLRINSRSERWRKNKHVIQKFSLTKLSLMSY